MPNRSVADSEMANHRDLSKEKDTSVSVTKYSLIGVLISIVIANLYLLVTVDNFSESIKTSTYNYSKLMMFIGFYGLVLGFFAAYFVNSWKEIISKEKASKKLLDEADKKVDELGKDYNLRILERNFKHLSAYYQESLAQSSKSFIAASLMCLLGFSILIVGVVLMYWGEAETAYITVASGVIAEFLALTIFKVYKQSMEKASDYHKKLLISQNINMGLKITETLENKSEKDTLKTDIVKVLMQDVNKHLSN